MNDLLTFAIVPLCVTYLSLRVVLKTTGSEVPRWWMEKLSCKVTSMRRRVVRQRDLRFNLREARSLP